MRSSSPVSAGRVEPSRSSTSARRGAQTTVTTVGPNRSTARHERRRRPRRPEQQAADRQCRGKRDGASSGEDRQGDRRHEVPRPHPRGRKREHQPQRERRLRDMPASPRTRQHPEDPDRERGHAEPIEVRPLDRVRLDAEPGRSRRREQVPDGVRIAVRGRIGVDVGEQLHSRPEWKIQRHECSDTDCRGGCDAADPAGARDAEDSKSERGQQQHGVRLHHHGAGAEERRRRPLTLRGGCDEQNGKQADQDVVVRVADDFDQDQRVPRVEQRSCRRIVPAAPGEHVPDRGGDEQVQQERRGPVDDHDRRDRIAGQRAQRRGEHQPDGSVGRGQVLPVDP
jgi:hypothetical protein